MVKEEKAHSGPSSNKKKTSMLEDFFGIGFNFSRSKFLRNYYFHRNQRTVDFHLTTFFFHFEIFFSFETFTKE